MYKSQAYGLQSIASFCPMTTLVSIVKYVFIFVIMAITIDRSLILLWVFFVDLVSLGTIRRNTLLLFVPFFVIIIYFNKQIKSGAF